MTVSTTLRKAGPFSGNGVSTAFPFAFKVFNTSDVVVTSVLVSTGVETVHVETVDYTVALNADQNASPGGVVNFIAPPATGRNLVVTSAVPLTQGVLITNLGGFYPAVFNDALDRLTIFAQQIAEVLSRSITTAITSNVSGSIPVLADAVVRFNSTGTGFVATSLAELAGLTAANTLVDNDMNASTVRAPSKSAAKTYIDAQDTSTNAATLAAAKIFAIAMACAL